MFAGRVTLWAIEFHTRRHIAHCNIHCTPQPAPVMEGRAICFQLGCTLFLLGGCTKSWIRFQDMLLMKLKLKHVFDWRTKTENQKLLRRWPGLKRARSSKTAAPHESSNSKQGPSKASCPCNDTKQPDKCGLTLYFCFLELQVVLKTLTHE